MKDPGKVGFHFPLWFSPYEIISPERALWHGFKWGRSVNGILLSGPFEKRSMLNIKKSISMMSYDKISQMSSLKFNTVFPWCLNLHSEKCLLIWCCFFRKHLISKFFGGSVKGITVDLQFSKNIELYISWKIDDLVFEEFDEILTELPELSFTLYICAFVLLQCIKAIHFIWPVCVFSEVKSTTFAITQRSTLHYISSFVCQHSSHLCLFLFLLGIFRRNICGIKKQPLYISHLHLAEAFILTLHYTTHFFVSDYVNPWPWHC